MHACIPKICSPKICMHACSLSMHIWGCATMFRWEKNDVPHIWVCPTMFRRRKTMFFAFGAVQRCFDGKKTMFPTFGAVQRCFAEKKRCSAHLGLSNDVFCFWAVQRCFAEKNGVQCKNFDVHHIWGCPTKLRSKKLMFNTFGRGKIDV